MWYNVLAESWRALEPEALSTVTEFFLGVVFSNVALSARLLLGFVGISVFIFYVLLSICHLALHLHRILSQRFQRQSKYPYPFRLSQLGHY